MTDSIKRTLTISITPQQAALMRDAVDGGGYSSDGEIVGDALRLWAEKQTLLHIDPSRLKKAYDEGMASGPGRHVSADDLLAELKQEARSRGRL